MSNAPRKITFIGAGSTIFAMFDPHTAAELDLDQISSLVDDLLAAHGEWIPEALRPGSEKSKAA